MKDYKIIIVLHIMKINKLIKLINCKIAQDQINNNYKIVKLRPVSNCKVNNKNNLQYKNKIFFKKITKKFYLKKKFPTNNNNNNFT